MANIDCLLVCTFGNFFAPVLFAAHTVSNLDLEFEQSFENEGYKSYQKSKQVCILRLCYAISGLPKDS